MDRTYWHKQTLGKPLYPELMWSQPENRQQAGKLLIIAGNLHGFSAAAEAYSESLKAGIGTARVVLPDALQKTVNKVFPEAEFTPSTHSGSFARESLAELIASAGWADGVLLAGNFGHNSETAIMLENFLEKFGGCITLTGDTIDFFRNNSSQLLDRPNTVAVPSFTQLQQLLKSVQLHVAITSAMDMLRFVDVLHDLTKTHAAGLVTQQSDQTIIAASGQVSTTPSSRTLLQVATHASVWWLQNPNKTFEAITASIAKKST